VRSTVIVDYGMGNLRSVQKALEKVGHPAAITTDLNVIRDAGKVILPGVGAFRDAIARLREAELVAPLLDHIRSGRPFLGICLGLQLLFTRSFEDGEHDGLDIFPGDVVRFAPLPGLKIPHMGWNEVSIRRRPPLLAETPDRSHFYFVHSYYVAPRDFSIVATETDYPSPFVSMVWKDNLYATQFHPEKSQRVGLDLLRRFAEL